MTFHAFTGTHSHELQIGKFVFQLRRRRLKPDMPWGFSFKPPLFNCWIDPFGKWL